MNHKDQSPAQANTGFRIVEFCFRTLYGRIEVRYRRVEGTKECEDMKAEFTALKNRLGKACPYFWRTASLQQLRYLPFAIALERKLFEAKRRP